MWLLWKVPSLWRRNLCWPFQYFPNQLCTINKIKKSFYLVLNDKTSRKLHRYYFYWFKWLVGGFLSGRWTFQLVPKFRLYQDIELGPLLFYLIVLCSRWVTGGVLTAKLNKIIICTSTDVVQLGQRQSCCIVNCLFSEDQFFWKQLCCLFGLCTERMLSCCEWQ